MAAKIFFANCKTSKINNWLPKFEIIHTGSNIDIHPTDIRYEDQMEITIHEADQTFPDANLRILKNFEIKSNSSGWVL